MSFIRKALYFAVLGALAYGLWVDSNFKQIAAGVAIFLFGMISLETGFKTFSGGTLQRILKKSTDRLWKSLSFGIVTTSLMQSSSLVSVLTISFLSAGLITLASGIGIIFGANLGTTTGAWIIAGFGLKVQLSAYALPMLVFGVVFLFQKSPTMKGMGYVLGGVGFLFLGIDYMKDGFDAFRNTIDLSAFAVHGYKGLFIYASIGIIATVIMQSSHATLVLILTALAAGQVQYENALALAIGSNVGTTISAIIGSLSANTAGKRLAVAHLVFNLVTGIVTILLIKEFVYLVDALSQIIGIRDHDFTLKLAVFHTLFNLAGVLLMVPFIAFMVRGLERLLPEPKAFVEEPKYLNAAALESGDASVEVVRKETIRLYDMALKIIVNGIAWRLPDILGDKSFKEIPTYSDISMANNLDAVYATQIKSVYSSTVDFITRARSTFAAPYSELLRELRGAGYHVVESVKAIKHLQKNLLVNIDSDNVYIKDLYNQFREEIGEVIRAINEIRQEPEDEVTTLPLDHVLMMIEQNDAEFEARIEELIRDQKISPSHATSLMTDVGYVRKVCHSLASMGKYLFGPSEEHLRQAERRLELAEEEREVVADDL
jgi:phosphate:Na+ symporter